MDIPSNFMGHTVTDIMSNAFDTKGLTSVTIPNGVQRIFDKAFQNNFLTGVIIPANINYI